MKYSLIPSMSRSQENREETRGWGKKNLRSPFKIMCKVLYTQEKYLGM